MDSEILESVHVAYLTNHISQPSLDISDIWIPHEPEIKFVSHTEGKIDPTDTSEFRINVLRVIEGVSLANLRF